MHRPPRISALEPRVPQPIRPRGPLSLLVLLVAVLLGIWLLGRTARPDGERPRAAGTQTAPTRAALERGVLAVEGAAAALPATERDPARAAAWLAARMNAQGSGVRFVVGRPTAAWQVALVPVDSPAAIRVEGYADELRLPVLMTELPLTR